MEAFSFATSAALTKLTVHVRMCDSSSYTYYMYMLTLAATAWMATGSRFHTPSYSSGPT
jgi:hypothetical protein